MKTQIRRQFVIAKRPMVLLLTLGLLAAGGLIAPPAHAATRGTNGQIAYATGGPNSANSQIFVKNADGSGLPRPLTPAAGYSEPTWSPDGTMIAVIAAVGPSRGIVLFPAKGGFPIGTLDADPNDREPAWSPNGRYIAFERLGHLMIVPVDLSTGAIPVADDAYSPNWSPDSSQLAYIDDASSSIRTVSVLPEVGTPVPRTDPGVAFAGFGVSWSPVGERIAFVGNGGNGFVIQYVTLGNLSPTTIFGTNGDGWPAWSPDGRQIAFFDLASGGIYTMDLIRNTRNTVDATGIFPAWQSCRYRCARR